MRLRFLILFILVSISVWCTDSDEIKCTCSPCGSCNNPSPPLPELSPPPPELSPPPPPPPSPPPPVVQPPSTSNCPPPPSELPPPSEPISQYPPVSPSPPSPCSGCQQGPPSWGPPGVLYPVDPGYRPSGASRNWVGLVEVSAGAVGGVLCLWFLN